MLKKMTCLLVSLFLVCAGVAAPVNAAVIATGDAFATTHQGQLNEVQAKLNRTDVQAAMVSLGVDPVQAQARVAAMSPAELNRLAAELDQLPAGGILALIGAVFVVLLILEITGVTHIFTNI